MAVFLFSGRALAGWGKVEQSIHTHESWNLLGCSSHESCPAELVAVNFWLNSSRKAGVHRAEEFQVSPQSSPPPFLINGHLQALSSALRPQQEKE